MQFTIWRQLNDESCAFACITLYIDRSPMRLDQLFCDRQPKSTVDPVGPRFVCTPETVEDERKILGRDS
jgi:hypothetical protein